MMIITSSPDAHIYPAAGMHLPSDSRPRAAGNRVEEGGGRTAAGRWHTAAREGSPGGRAPRSDRGEGGSRPEGRGGAATGILRDGRSRSHGGDCVHGSLPCTGRHDGGCNQRLRGEVRDAHSHRPGVHKDGGASASAPCYHVHPARAQAESVRCQQSSVTPEEDENLR